MNGKMTPGQALRILDRPKAAFPNAAEWDDLSEEERGRYNLRAQLTLELADKIMGLLVDGMPG